MTVICNHIGSAKHSKNKETLKSKELRNKECLQKYNDEVHMAAETLPEAQQVFRVKVVTAFLKAGIPQVSLSILKIFWRRTTIVWLMKADLST